MNLQIVLKWCKMNGFSLWYIKVVYDIIQLAEAKMNLK